MLAKVSLLAGLACASSASDLSNWCGSDSPISKKEMTNQLAMQKSISAQPDFRLAALKEIKVNTYIHIVGNTTAETKRLMSDAVVKKQMKVLNEDYKNSATGFSFHVKSIHRYADAEWASDYPFRDTPDDTRKGKRVDLNLYYMTHLADYGLEGVSAFPWETNATDYSQDRVYVSTGSAPGGPDAPHNDGHTTTHEVGHWLGLWHTFQNGCEGGDYVDDTPAQKEPSSGCPVGQDSCDYPGLDPIHNYMDYSSCTTEFTPGQVARMHFIWDKYRV